MGWALVGTFLAVALLVLVFLLFRTATLGVLKGRAAYRREEELKNVKNRNGHYHKERGTHGDAT